MRYVEGGVEGEGGTHPLVFMDIVVEENMYATEFDFSKGCAKVVVNSCIIPKEEIERALTILRGVLVSGIAVSPYVRLCDEGEDFHGLVVPPGYVALITVCSITLCGALLKAGIPVKPKLGGIVHVENCVAQRFTQVMSYSSTTMDPLEALLSQELTSVSSVVDTGSGKILASLHESPIASRDAFHYVVENLSKMGFAGILEVGEPNNDVLGVPVSVNHFGFVVVGGTNPMAAMQEAGIPVILRAMSEVVELSELLHFEMLV